MGRAKSNRSISPAPTSPSDPAHPSNLKRSLARNDVELAALTKLHASLRLLREAIVKEFGEDGLIEMVLSHKDRLKDGGLKSVETVEPEKLTMDTETVNNIDDDDDAVNNDNDNTTSASKNTTRRDKLSTAFLLRMKLRRRLLNRLARRLHRVAHTMDTNSRNIDAPAPPQYGDQMRRYVKNDEDGNPVIMAEGAKNIRESDVEEFRVREEERGVVRKGLEERRRDRAAAAVSENDNDEDNEDDTEKDDDAMDVDVVTPTPVELLLKHDEEDKPLLDKLVEYEVGYDKVYTLGKPTPPPLPSPSKKSKAKPTTENNNDGGDDKNNKEETKKEATPEQQKETDSTPAKEGEEDNNKEVVTMSLPIVDTVDTHEMGEGGEASGNHHDTQNISRVPYSMNGRAPPPMDRAAEWKRWTKEICDRIPDQVTFDDLGVGGDGVIFELEARLESAKRKAGGGGDYDGGGDGAADYVALNRGKGKVLRRSEEPEEKKPEDDGDVNMADASKLEEGKEQKTDKEKADEKEKELAAKNMKPFSVKPVPSFYHQDLQRVKIIQSELVRFANIYETRELLQIAQQSYDTAYKASVSLQQAKAQLANAISKMTHKHQYDLAGLQQQAKHQVAQSRAHWERRQWLLKEVKKNFGEEGAFVRSVCNDVLTEAKDRVEVRYAQPMPGGGSGQTTKAAFLAKQAGDDEKVEVANVIGKIVDCIDRRYQDMLTDYPKSFIPPPIANENTVVGDSETGETLAEVQKRESTELKARLEKIENDFKEAEKKRTAAWTALSKAKTEVGSAPTTTKARKAAPARQAQPTQQQQYQAMQAQRAAAQQAQLVQVQGLAGPMYVSQAQLQQMQIQQHQQLQQQQMIASQTARMIQAQVAQQNAARVVVPAQVALQVPQKVHVPVQVAAAAAVSPPTEDGEPKKLTQNEKYGYGDRYSSANVEARKNPDGTVFPVQQPKLMPNGEFARPAGRQRRGMGWDAKRGCWFPVPESPVFP